MHACFDVENIFILVTPNIKTRQLSFLFISTGPKPKTIVDFWTMISQEEVTVIVCLTKLNEGAKVSIMSFSYETLK